MELRLSCINPLTYLLTILQQSQINDPIEAMKYILGLVQDCGISSANALDIP